MQIGRFTVIGDSYVGQLETVMLNVPLRIVPLPDSGTDKAPDWRVQINDETAQPEIGAGWTHGRDGGGTFITVQIDCPTFPRPLRANLLPSRTHPDVHVLLWTRQKHRAAEA